MFTTRILGRVSRAAIVVAATAFVAGAVPASAARLDDPEAAAKAPAKQNGDQPVSKRKYCVQGATTGTLLPMKVCRTRDQWIKETGVDPVKAK
jgi:hypothetical protein